MFVLNKKLRYFFKINRRVLIAITQFKILGNIINKIGGRTSNALIGIKHSGVFDQFYSDIKELKESMLSLTQLNSFQSEYYQQLLY